MKFLDPDTLLITDYKNGLMRLDVRTPARCAHLERRNSERFKGVNDLVFDRDGNLYFTDQGQSGNARPHRAALPPASFGSAGPAARQRAEPQRRGLSPDERFSTWP
jgi:gluconolactonase